MTQYSPVAIANALIERALDEGRGVTQMQLQKLAYLAYAWHLARTNGDRLVEEHPEAWQYGPVFPSLYRAASPYGSSPIRGLLIQKSGPYQKAPRVPRFDEEANRTLNDVWEVYGTYDAVKLMMMTHQPDTPWSEAYKGATSRGDVISDESILRHWRHLIAQPDGASGD